MTRLILGTARKFVADILSVNNVYTLPEYSNLVKIYFPPVYSSRWSEQMNNNTRSLACIIWIYVYGNQIWPEQTRKWRRSIENGSCGGALYGQFNGKMKARYSLTVLKVPLNPNSINQSTERCFYIFYLFMCARISYQVEHRCVDVGFDLVVKKINTSACVFIYLNSKSYTK